MAKPPWYADYKPGVWHNIYKPFVNPTFQIPDYLQYRFNNMRPTVMPASVAVDAYRVRLERSEQISEYGFNKMHAEVDVRWKQKALDLIPERKELLGDVYKDLETARSQAAFASPHLLLNEVSRKIERTKDTLAIVRRIGEQLRDEDWEDLILELHEIVLNNLSYDEEHLEKYVNEHKRSTIIHGHAGHYPSLKWPQLRKEDHLYFIDLIKEMLEQWIANWDKWRHMILKPEAPGYGIRGRTEKFEEYKGFYEYDIDRARQIGFIVILSSWFAYLNDKVKDYIYQRMADVSSDKLGCEVILPSLERGAYWKRVSDALEEGHALVNGDGSNWEAWSATIVDLFCEAVDHGVPQYMSGCAFTSVIGTLASLILSEYILKSTSRMELIGASGDDLLAVGPQPWIDKIESLPKVWEIDELSTRGKLILGCVILPDDRGTFASMRRITIDSGEKVIAGDEIQPGMWTPWIKGTASTQAEDAYFEIQSKGTLNGEPLLRVMAGIDDVDFYETWHKDRLEMFGAVPNVEE